MAEFSEMTVGTPRSDILSILILQRRNDVINALEQFNKLGGQEFETGSVVSLVRSRLLALFLEIRAPMKKDVGAEAYSDLIRKCSCNDIEKLTEAFMFIDEWLYKKNITKIDSRKHTDPTDLEENNDAHQV